MEPLSTASVGSSDASLCPSETTLQAFNSSTALLMTTNCASITMIDLENEGKTDNELVLNATDLGVVHYVHAAELAASTINLSGNPLQSVHLASANTGLTKVDLSDNRLSAIDYGILPNHLTALSLSNNALSELVNCSFPDSLTHLLFADNAIASMGTTELPPALELLDLRGNSLTSVEIRVKDVSIWAKATVLPTINQEKCADSRAKVQQINDHRVCVISDALFEQKKYAKESTVGSTATSSSKHSTLSIMLGLLYAVIGLAAVIAAVFVGRKILQKRRAQRESDQINQYLDARELTPPPEMLLSRHSSYTRSSNINSRAIRQSSKLPRLQSHSPRGSGFLRPFLRVLSGVKHEPTATTALPPKPTNDSITEDCSAATAVLSSSMCVALELDDFRIPDESVKLGQRVNKGAFSHLYLATISEADKADREVIVRRPASHRQTNSFVDAICQSMTLKHSNIVSFLGFTYMNDVPCALLERMPKGDLQSLLATRPPNRQCFQWFQRGGFSPKSKAEIALDVIDALVHLHSLSTKVFFRNLRAKKVLLAEDFTAKLCAFGNDSGPQSEPPRSMSVVGSSVTTGAFYSSSSASFSPTASMTPDSKSCPRENSVAWMAPELLRGQRHATEQTDMYAFGVLLTELDTCELPYTLGIDDLDREQVAMLVSSGCIRPSLAMDCPVPIQELILKCLSFSAEDRPAGVEVQYALRKLVNKSHACPPKETGAEDGEEVTEPQVDTVETVDIEDKAPTDCSGEGIVEPNAA